MHVAHLPVSICQSEHFTIFQLYTNKPFAFISFRLRIKEFFLFFFYILYFYFYFIFMIHINTSLIFLTKTYTPHGGFHSSQWRSPFLHWVASQPRCVALSMRELVEYYVVSKQNGYIP